MPYELLSGLANCLLNETIFEIVEGLTEIQQVTEKQLLQQRLQLLHRHKAEKEAHARQAVQEELEEVVARQKQELKSADMNLILQLDQIVADQQTSDCFFFFIENQNTLEKAGVPGFGRTTNLQEIQVQMYLLEFIAELSKTRQEASIT